MITEINNYNEVLDYIKKYKEQIEYITNESELYYNQNTYETFYITEYKLFLDTEIIEINCKIKI